MPQLPVASWRRQRQWTPPCSLKPWVDTSSLDACLVFTAPLAAADFVLSMRSQEHGIACSHVDLQSPGQWLSDSCICRTLVELSYRYGTRRAVSLGCTRCGVA